ncbi:TPA: hypothetical protein DCY43_02795 [candidate division WWE3 bacterium]|uniref:Phosphoribosyltransferase domain-containing protein n=2 Tax=Katanobacteria TaxID=422282 RepID=A0A351JTN2_UNCKA|nr:hypothetical protein [candidate division WWE3 bacterium]
MEKLLTSVFGETCYFCGRGGRVVCYSCLAKASVCEAGVCIYCQKETVLGVSHPVCSQAGREIQLCCIYNYQGLVAEIIKKSKYNPKMFSLLKLLAYEGATLSSKFGYNFSGFTVVPIPISKSREKDRGFNQAEIIAHELAKKLKLQVDTSILVRIKDTTKQFDLGRESRAQNIKGAFAVSNPTLVKGRKILLVDDICTTGATLIESSSAFYECCLFPSRVSCLSLAAKL